MNQLELLKHERFSRSPDNHIYLNGPDKGGDLAEKISYYCRDNIKDLTQGNYLACGVGGAIAELSFANKLGFSANKIYLLDKEFGDYIFENLKEFDSVDAKVIPFGLLNFLFNYKEFFNLKFTMVTAFGMDYFLRDKSVLIAVLTELSEIVKPGGIFYAFPQYFFPSEDILLALGWKYLKSQESDVVMILQRV
ncbi:MAG TPA: hypothetical protein VF209_00850 [Patescibacteria group bacterium]